jgi:hypothetical protein
MATAIPNENVYVAIIAATNSAMLFWRDAEVGAHAKHNVSLALQRLQHAEQTPACENL